MPGGVDPRECTGVHGRCSWKMFVVVHAIFLMWVCSILDDFSIWDRICIPCFFDLKAVKPFMVGHQNQQFPLPINSLAAGEAFLLSNCRENFLGRGTESALTHQHYIHENHPACLNSPRSSTPH